MGRRRPSGPAGGPDDHHRALAYLRRTVYMTGQAKKMRKYFWMEPDSAS
jgi:hypothetical protein